MATALQSLRVTAEMDASAYARGAQQKIAADNQMIASDKARNASLAQTDAAMAKIPGGMASVSKALLDGYGAGAQFEAIVRRIGSAVDRGMGLDRANVLLDAAYRKFGLTADAAVLAQRGFVSITGAVAALNNEYSIHNEVAARAVAEMQRVAAAQGAQAQVSARFGIGGETKSAQESAEAFLAQYGGLEGIARAKAQEAGAAFGAELDTRLISGTQKSARDSASVFDIELKRLEVIAQQRAQQVGQNFQAGLNASLGIGGPSATSQGATYSALAEQIERLDQIEQARAAHQAQVTQQNVAAAFGYDRVAKSARDSAAVFAEVAAAEDRAAAKASALRAAINPLEAEMVSLGKQMAEYRSLLNQGVISSTEFEQAQVHAAKRLSDVDMNLRQAATGGRVLSGELGNLGYQVNDVITGLALGQPLFMIAAQQGGQVYQILSRSKASVGEFASSYASSILGMITPTRLAFGTIITLVGTAIAALNSYLSAQDKVKIGLSGAGRASGASVEGINSIANAGSAYNLSIASARELATAIASTGKVANDNLLPIVKIGKDFATTFGITDVEAAKQLAGAFADPARGAEQLNERLGFLEAGMQRQIASLVAQNRLYDAQKILLEGVQGSLARTAEVTGAWTQIWNAVKNAASNYFDKIGEGIAKVLHLNDNLEEQRAASQKRLDSYSSTLGKLFGSSADYENEKKTLAEINALIEKRAQSTRDVAAAQASLRVQGTILGALPEINARQALADAAAVGGSTSEDPVLMKALGLTQTQVDRAKAILQQLKQDFKTTFEEIQTSAKIAYDAVTAFSPAAKALIAQRQAVEQYRAAGGIDPAEKQKIAQDAYNLSLKQTLTMLSEQARVRALTANQSVATAALEIQLLDKTVGKQAELRANLQARQQLEQEASQNRTAFDNAQYERLKKINAELGKQTDLAALATMNSNIRFGAKTSLLSPEDVQIAQQLRGIYPDVATALASVEAQGLRVNNALSGVSSQISGQLVTGLTDIADGTKSIGQGASDMGRSVARAIQEMIVKLYVVIPLMRALQSMVGGPLTGLMGGGGASGVGAAQDAAAGGFGSNVVNAQALGNAFGMGNAVPFARGGAFTNKIFNNPTLFKFAYGGGIRSGLMGEAGPEAVMPLRRGPDGKLGVASAGGGGGMNVGLKVNIQNYGNDNVSTGSVRQGSNGELELDVVIGQAAARQMGNPGSALRQVTDQRARVARR